MSAFQSRAAGSNHNRINKKIKEIDASSEIFGIFVRYLVMSSWVLCRINCSNLLNEVEASVMGVGDLSLNKQMNKKKFMISAMKFFRFCDGKP